ncbi:uncharacterized protein THITE_50821 [Thermothielavioides terrestris NRRL 8126]|uniref:F-box domain-containing protein n=1 Tax=Thermothielavioides terrestris (strain ATCC 38088 / NRRL 8126) TaxID=578455 RepID=G2RGL4_THETT|nr:uncharacterized protein THITE_50821 [Thermothielavioides terrestris NRRL 8126]AEO71903.1 hypothetical protein THITE_50821 [Thermothielavioides terrestris NRRL 8126]
MPTTTDPPGESRACDVAPVAESTRVLPCHSKRAQRQLRKQEKRARRQPKLQNPSGFQDLPCELMMEILELLRPSDIFALLRVCKALRSLILDNEAPLMRAVTNLRYSVLQRCFLRPVPLQDVSPALRPLLRSPRRPDLQHGHRPQHQHIPPPDPAISCTCLTCVGRWYSLCAVVDFAHWQDHLDKGTPIPQIPRGTFPAWNQELMAENAKIVNRCLTRPLWYARVLEAHLDSTVRSVRRHSQNKADKRAHFRLTEEDVRAGTDAFLERPGASEVVYPFSRDNYYMLEAFLPGRAWIAERQEWAYLSNGQAWHEVDLAMLAKLMLPGRRSKEDPVLPAPSAQKDGNLSRDDLYRHYGSHSRWEKYDVPKCPVIEVTEVWVEDDDLSSPALVETKTIPSLDIDNWLEESPFRCFPGGAYSRALRLVWVGQEGTMKRTSPSTKVLERLAKAWKLDDALDYARSCFAGVSATAPRGETLVFTVAYHPKLVAAWSRPALAPEEPTPETQAIVFAEGEERAELRRILGSKWSAATVRHPMFPALFCGLTLAHGLDNTLEDIKAAVREVEARTGHHRFTSRHQTQPAAGELGQLSAQMSGCAAKLANGTRKMKVVEAINDFIQQHATTSPAELGENTAFTAAEPFSASHIDLLRHRVQMQAVDTAYVQQRVQIQIAALFHLIAQQDNAIAFDAARATHSIAASSLEDSSSMKMLALVAMFFLPGSFVAALFSAPLFAWDEASATGGMGVATKPQFALFWAVTAPLTVLVFALYALWICFQKRRERGSAKDLDAIPI